MGLNKIVKEFKNQLDQREIKPTPAAWDRLDAMLTLAEEKKAMPLYNWLYIAASIIGFIAIGFVFFSQTEELVDVKRNDVVIKNNTPIQAKDSIQKEIQNPNQLHQKQEVIAEHSYSTPQKTRNQIASEKNQKYNTTIANKTNKLQSLEQSIINQKTNEINSNQLNQITKETQIAAVESKPKSPTVKVNAANLLSEVDTELELSFREKVIRKIDKNYKTVKIALANRNQQSNTN
jgi:hypothetical protein